jgi:isopenicillin-N N-acyltransferase-like protein
VIVHRSEEAPARERGEAFGRACAPQVAHTLDVYRRMIGSLDGSLVRVSEDERAELEGIATGAGVPVSELLAINARTELLASVESSPDECSVVGGGALLAQNWDWHPDFAESTLMWVVRQPGGGWFATLTEAGILAKIGLNHAGLGVCLNLLQNSEDGGVDGVPIHVLLRRVLATCTTLEDALALLCGARVSASSAVTVAVPGDVATVELSPGGPSVVRGGFHTNHFLVPPPSGSDSGLPESESTELRLDVIRRLPLLEALRSHDGHPWGVCRHGDDSVPWAENTVTIASVIMDLAARRLRVAMGTPCTAAYEEVPLPVAVA